MFVRASFIHRVCLYFYREYTRQSGLFVLRNMRYTNGIVDSFNNQPAPNGRPFARCLFFSFERSISVVLQVTSICLDPIWTFAKEN